MLYSFVPIECGWPLPVNGWQPQVQRQHRSQRHSAVILATRTKTRPGLLDFLHYSTTKSIHFLLTIEHEKNCTWNNYPSGDYSPVQQLGQDSLRPCVCVYGVSAITAKLFELSPLANGPLVNCQFPGQLSSAATTAAADPQTVSSQ